MDQVHIVGLNQFSPTNLTHATTWRADDIPRGEGFNTKPLEVRCAANLLTDQERPLGRIHGKGNPETD